MFIKKESELLDVNIRKKIIDDILGDENQRRKDVAYRRQMVYQDETYRFVISSLLKQFSEQTVREMSFAISNLSILRKVIDKLARVYSAGVTREIVDNDELSDVIKSISNELCMNTKLKQINRMLKLHHNTALYVKPCAVFDDDTENGKIVLAPMAPYLYDVVENHYDRTTPMAYIFSNYQRRSTGDYIVNWETNDGRNNSSGITVKGDNIDQLIADVAEDTDKPGNSFVWWTKQYHFTTDEKGNVTSAEIENPIGEIPIVNFSIDQMNSFWAEGGNDLDMGSILINSMITNINYIGVTQGYGQFYMIGKKLPKTVVTGPNRAIIIDYEDAEDPKPELGYLNSNPSLGALMDSVKMYTALLLTTNNLTTSGVSTQLDGTGSFPSGIALMLDKAESMEDVTDQQQLFIDKEKEVFSIIGKWLQYYNSQNMLNDDLKELILPEEFELSVRFNDIQQIITESEKLDNLQKRKDLGLSTAIDLIILDNPALTKEQAEEKLKEILEQRMKQQMSNVIQNNNAAGKVVDETDTEEPIDKLNDKGNIVNENKNKGRREKPIL